MVAEVVKAIENGTLANTTKHLYLSALFLVGYRIPDAFISENGFSDPNSHRLLTVVLSFQYSDPPKGFYEATKSNTARIPAYGSRHQAGAGRA